MAGRIRWLGVGMVVCFLALFLQLNNVQVMKAHKYATDPYNPRCIAAKFDQPRGIIQSADGVVLAPIGAVKNPCRTCYKYERQYPHGALFAQITGYFPIDGLVTGVENTYDAYLAQHNRPVKTIADLLTTPVETDTVTLTLSSKLQSAAQQALDGRDGAIVVLDPTTGAVLAMYSNPTFDPNPLAVNDADRRWPMPSRRTPRSTRPRVLPGRPRSRTRTSSRRGRLSRSSRPLPRTSTRPSSSNTSMPFYGCIPHTPWEARARLCATTAARRGRLWRHDRRDAPSVVRHRLRPPRYRGWEQPP